MTSTPFIKEKKKIELEGWKKFREDNVNQIFELIHNKETVEKLLKRTYEAGYKEGVEDTERSLHVVTGKAAEEFYKNT